LIDFVPLGLRDVKLQKGSNVAWSDIGGGFLSSSLLPFKMMWWWWVIQD